MIPSTMAVAVSSIAMREGVERRHRPIAAGSRAFPPEVVDGDDYFAATLLNLELPVAPTEP